MKRTGYRDRQHAGEVLAEILLPYREKKPVVLAVPRGGIPVALPIVFALNCDFDLIIARKIADSRQPELAIGAVGEDGPVLLNNRLVRYFNLSPEDVETMKAEKQGNKNRLQAYRVKSRGLKLRAERLLLLMTVWRRALLLRCPAVGKEPVSKGADSCRSCGSARDGCRFVPGGGQGCLPAAAKELCSGGTVL